MDLAAIITPSQPASRTRFAAISSDGAHVVTADGETATLPYGATVTAGGAVVAAAVLGGAVWLVTHAAEGHVLHRFHPSGARVAAPHTLGELGEDVVIAANRLGARVALIEGEHGVVVRERDGELAIESLGARTGERRVLVGTRGVAERCGAAIKLRSGAMPPLALPPDLVRSTIGAAAVVLDGTALLLELVTRNATTVVVYDLRRAAATCKRIRIGDARVLAIAELAGVVVLGRGSHVALLDVRVGRCIGERILAAAATGCAIDATAEHTRRRGCRWTRQSTRPRDDGFRGGAGVRARARARARFRR